MPLALFVPGLALAGGDPGLARGRLGLADTLAIDLSLARATRQRTEALFPCADGLQCRYRHLPGWHVAVGA
jgi:hypothetical protein